MYTRTALYDRRSWFIFRESPIGPIASARLSENWGMGIEIFPFRSAFSNLTRPLFSPRQELKGLQSEDSSQKPCCTHAPITRPGSFGPEMAILSRLDPRLRSCSSIANGHLLQLEFSLKVLHLREQISFQNRCGESVYDPGVSTFHNFISIPFVPFLFALLFFLFFCIPASSFSSSFSSFLCCPHTC